MLMDFFMHKWVVPNSPQKETVKVLAMGNYVFRTESILHETPFEESDVVLGTVQV